MALSAEALITLADAKAELEISDSSQDAALERLIMSATRAIEQATGAVFVQRTVSRHASSGQRQRLLALEPYPIVAVTSITDDEGRTIAGSDYFIDGLEGVLRHQHTWPSPYGRYTVVYTAGRYPTTADVPEDLQEAARLLLRHYYEQPEGGDIVSTQVGDLSIRYAEQPAEQAPRLPARVLALIAPYRSIGL